MKSLSLDEVGELHDVSTRTVEWWVANGELRAINVSRDPKSKKPRLRVLQVDLDKFLAARSTDAAALQKRPRRKRVEILEEFV